MSAEPTSLLRPAKKSLKGPAGRLRTELEALAQGRAAIVNHFERAWASITFSGTRHTLKLEFSGDDAVHAGEEFVADLPDHEFQLIGQLVADASITQVEHTLLPQPKMAVECELLLLLDG